MNDPSSVDAFGRHLATLLTAFDLSPRVVPPATRPPISDLLVLARAATGAERISLFRVRGLSGDGGEPLEIARLARADRQARDDFEHAFDEHASALLLSCLGSGASEAVAPVGSDEPFRAAHASLEPDASPYVVFVPVTHAAEPLGVLEATRADRAFAPAEIALLEAAAAVATSAVFLTEREDTIAAAIVSLLPPDARQTPLRTRLRRFLEARRSGTDERRALVVAASIAELARSSSRALMLADELLEAIHRGFGTDGGGGRDGVDDLGSPL